jgi:flagellar assembly protein FliH
LGKVRKSLTDTVIKIQKPFKNFKVISRTETNYKIEECYRIPKQELNPVLEESVVEKTFQPFMKITETELNDQLQNAYQQGLEAGYQQNREETRQKFQNQLKYLDKIAANVIQSKDDFFKKGEEIIIKLTLLIVQKILHHEIKTNPENLIPIVNNALKKVTDIERNVVVNVNPSDKDLLTLHLNEIGERVDSLRELVIKADSRISQGGCVVETNYVTIDATMETQFHEFERVLLNSVLTDNE